MENISSRIWTIADRVGTEVTPSLEELHFSEKYISSEYNETIRSNSCMIIISSSEDEVARNRAICALGNLCQNKSHENWAITVLVTFLYMSNKELVSNQNFEYFCHFAAKSNRWELRCNAVSVLEKFSKITKHNESQAIELIRLLSSDKNKYVRSCASSALSGES